MAAKGAKHLVFLILLALKTKASAKVDQVPDLSTFDFTAVTLDDTDLDDGSEFSNVLDLYRTVPMS